MHDYRSNQSALMTRCGTDLRHQYGIFGDKSQMSFSRNATRAGSEEGRLFSQASSYWVATIGVNNKPVQNAIKTINTTEKRFNLTDVISYIGE